MACVRTFDGGTHVRGERTGSVNWHPKHTPGSATKRQLVLGHGSRDLLQLTPSGSENGSETLELAVEASRTAPKVEVPSSSERQPPVPNIVVFVVLSEGRCYVHSSTRLAALLSRRAPLFFSNSKWKPGGGRERNRFLVLHVSLRLFLLPPVFPLNMSRLGLPQRGSCFGVWRRSCILFASTNAGLIYQH